LIKMSQSLHSLLLAKNASTASTSLGSPKIPDQRQNFPKSAGERDYDRNIYDLPQEQEEEELIGTSVLIYEDISESTSDSPRISNEFHMEAADKLEANKYRSSDRASAEPTLLVNNAKDNVERKRLELENESLTLKIQQHKHIISNNLEETQRLRDDNESLQMQLQQLVQKKSKSDKDLKDSDSRCDDLLRKVAELEESKANFRKAKLEHDTSLQRLSSENGFLKAAQRDISSVNLSAEKKTAALEASKLTMMEQVSLSS
jgi:hypothetical protein